MRLPRRETELQPVKNVSELLILSRLAKPPVTAPFLRCLVISHLEIILRKRLLRGLGNFVPRFLKCLLISFMSPFMKMMTRRTRFGQSKTELIRHTLFVSARLIISGSTVQVHAVPARKFTLTVEKSTAVAHPIAVPDVNVTDLRSSGIMYSASLTMTATAIIQSLHKRILIQVWVLKGLHALCRA